MTFFIKYVHVDSFGTSGETGGKFSVFKENRMCVDRANTSSDDIITL